MAMGDYQTLFPQPTQRSPETIKPAWIAQLLTYLFSSSCYGKKIHSSQDDHMNFHHAVAVLDTTWQTPCWVCR